MNVGVFTNIFICMLNKLWLLINYYTIKSIELCDLRRSLNKSTKETTITYFPKEKKMSKLQFVSVLSNFVNLIVCNQKQFIILVVDELKNLIHRHSRYFVKLFESRINART